MPEWPEIHHLARQMAQELPGIALYEARIAQPKCLNLPEEAWRERVLGRAVQAVRAKGKWLDVALRGYRLRINLGMGGEILLSEAGETPAEKWRALFPCGWAQDQHPFLVVRQPARGGAGRGASAL